MSGDFLYSQNPCKIYEDQNFQQSSIKFSIKKLQHNKQDQKVSLA